MDVSYYYIYMDRLVHEDGLWVVYRHSDVWGDCPVFKTPNKELAKRMFDL